MKRRPADVARRKEKKRKRSFLSLLSTALNFEKWPFLCLRGCLEIEAGGSGGLRLGLGGSIMSSAAGPMVSSRCGESGWKKRSSPFLSRTDGFSHLSWLSPIPSDDVKCVCAERVEAPRGHKISAFGQWGASTPGLLPPSACERARACVRASLSSIIVVWMSRVRPLLLRQ